MKVNDSYSNKNAQVATSDVLTFATTCYKPISGCVCMAWELGQLVDDESVASYQVNRLVAS